MGVHMTGNKAGVWLDGETGQSGDLIGLWMAVKGVSLRDACTEAMEYLGIREDRLDPPPRKSYAKPTRSGVSKLSAEHRHWLVNVRKLAPERSAERRGGKERVRTSRSRWWQYQSETKTHPMPPT